MLLVYRACTAFLFWAAAGWLFLKELGGLTSTTSASTSSRAIVIQEDCIPVGRTNAAERGLEMVSALTYLRPVTSTAQQMSLSVSEAF